MHILDRDAFFVGWSPIRRMLLALFCLILLPIARAAEPAAPRHVRFREPHASHYVLDESPDDKDWSRAHRDGSSRQVEIGSRLVLQLEPGTDLGALLKNRPVKLAQEVTPNLFILQAADSRAAIDAAEGFAAEKGVIASYPIMRRAYRHQNAYSFAPNDSYFTDQFHLDNRGPDSNLAGPDLNVRAAWPVALGNGVLVAVADLGVQLDHPDLTNRASGNPHFNFFLNTSDGGPYSSTANHGTAVAGLIAAEKDNHRGVTGVAPRAKLASWVIFGTSTFSGAEAIASDDQLMAMFQYASNRVAVQNHSWGSIDTAQSPIDSLSEVGISNAVARGRGGKGVVIVRAGGNNRDDLINANDDGFASDPRVISVAAVRKDGRACSYSSAGACLLAGAPSGDVIDTNGDGVPDSVDPNAPDVYTTDRTGSLGYNASGSGDRPDYAGFNGTSAASPQVAGVAALILSANTNLNFRDVQQIVLHSARHFDMADPDLHTNGAGFRFSHNVGFGVPDAGFAVALAKAWSNRPTVREVKVQNGTVQSIPDDALRVVCAASGLPASLASIRSLPSFGPHPDDPTATLPLVYVGQANSEITQDLHGKAALIQRGVSFFADKIARAARAGASFAVIFNNLGTEEIQRMGGTDYSPIPALSIGRTSGEALRDFITIQPQTTARLQLTPVVYNIPVSDTLVCEHVGLRLKTTHTSRSDVRVTLVSPMGTRSILQAINADNSAGPSDWTYWTVQHFYESSAGSWRIEVSDELNTLINGSPAVGSVTSVQLIVRGVTIVDTDRDGLDDNWERQYFGSLIQGPKDDPDGDGFRNAREQIMRTDPVVPNSLFKLDIAQLASGYWRLSWPARDTARYTVFSGSNLALPLNLARTNFPGRLPVSEFVVKPTANQFFRVGQTNGL